MPRFYFDLHNDVEALDEEGCDLPDLRSAKLHALAEARIMVQASVAETGRIDLGHHIDIRDGSGEILHVLLFEDAVTVKRGPRVLSEASPPQ